MKDAHSLDRILTEALIGLYGVEKKISPISLEHLFNRAQQLRINDVFSDRPITLLNLIMYDCLANYQKPNYRRYFTQLSKLFSLDDNLQLELMPEGMGDNFTYALKNFIKGSKPQLCGLTSEFDNDDSSLIIMITKSFFLHADSIDIESRLEDIFKQISSFTHITNRHKRSYIANVILFSIINKIVNRRLKSNRPITHRELVISMRSGVRRASKWIRPSLHQQGEIGYYAKLEYHRLSKKLHIEKTNPSELHTNRYCVDVIVNLCYIISHYQTYRLAVNNAFKLMPDVHSLSALVGFIYGLAFTDRVVPKQWVNGKDQIQKLINKKK